MNDARLLRRGLWLEYLTLGWNIGGVAVVFSAARMSASIALFGFGLDSLLEIGASLVVVWQLKGGGRSRERAALRGIGAAFFALAIYIALQSARSLWLHLRPEPSTRGIIWLALTCAVMLALAWGKARTGAQLKNAVLQAEARVTVVDALLAACVLVGIALNGALGWWWADPVASLVIVVYGVKEGVHAWREADGSSLWATLKGFGRAFKRQLAVYRLVLADPRTPRVAKFFLGAAIGYVLLPFDLIPDFIPVLGQLDDLLIVPALVWLALKFVPREVLDECRQKVESEA